MDTQELIAALGYADSPQFLPPSRFDEVPVFAHVFRRAERRCALQGVYLLRREQGASSPVTPVVYVARAEDRKGAHAIHRQVWNQSVVPFLIVHTPKGVLLYSGFAYQENLEEVGESSRVGVLDSLIGFHEVALRLAAFRASQIDSGELWRHWGDKVQSEQRVDHRLLRNLEAIGQRLHDEGLARESAHALIGKLVYLRYLRDRDILSDRRLGAWNIKVENVFGRELEVSALRDLVSRTDEWLNGEIFPQSFQEDSGISSHQIEQTAAVFLGDDPVTGQLHLDFQAYDFSHIPIETLSTIYEQFLAIEGSSRESGAFYTPVPVVNFMITEMEDHKPLKPGMRVLDPSCGSGAFLVQCYRQLIEKRIVSKGRRLRPVELRDILEKQIFGVDRDGDACRVAQMSLVLTMLDYINPPDLQSTPNFKLPNLSDRNIYQSDFFNESSDWAKGERPTQFDWVIGNPPWIEISSKSGRDRYALNWLAENSETYPVTNKQTAEMFAWESRRYTGAEGILGLLMPAMTLFKGRNVFRRKFFCEVSTLGVANFTNLRRDLFVRYQDGKKKKMEIPVVALFFRSCDPGQNCSLIEEYSIPVFSPLLLNQEAVRPSSTKSRAKVWGLSVNRSEIQFVDPKHAASGDMLPWKVAMWGTGRDRRLIERIRHRFQDLGGWAVAEGLSLGQGVELRKSEAQEPTEAAPEVVGEKKLNSIRTRDVRHLHALPGYFLNTIPEEDGFVRKGRSKPLEVCRPPHVILSAARTFAVYLDEFILVPPRQIGIAGSSSQSSLLKALALYLSSDFSKYFEFFESPQWGIRDGRSTLATLKKLPMPLAGLGEAELGPWCELHRELTEASRNYLDSPLQQDHGPPESLLDLERELNRTVESVLGLSQREHWLVHDLVHVRMYLTDGKLGDPASRRPGRNDLSGYAVMLRDELDAFIGSTEGLAHRVKVFRGRYDGLVSVEMVRGSDALPIPVDIREAADPVTREIERLQKQHLDITEQWIYFDRNLFVFDRDRTLIFKPQQRLWWTRSQAMSDADEILSAALAPESSVLPELSSA